VGFDVPGSPPDDPETIYRATLNAFAAGAHGIVVSREYEEMEIPHLRAVGRAVREVIRAGQRADSGHDSLRAETG
jgi:hypothetical protein